MAEKIMTARAATARKKKVMDTYSASQLFKVLYIAGGLRFPMRGKINVFLKDAREDIRHCTTRPCLLIPSHHTIVHPLSPPSP